MILIVPLRMPGIAIVQGENLHPDARTFVTSWGGKVQSFGGASLVPPAPSS